MREAREERGLTLLQVEIDTRIRSAILQALEEGDLDNLPPEPFLRGLIRSYASYLRLDVGQVLDLYAADRSPTVPSPAPPVPKRPLAALHIPAVRPPLHEKPPDVRQTIPPALPEEESTTASYSLPEATDLPAEPPTPPNPSETFVPEPPLPISQKKNRLRLGSLMLRLPRVSARSAQPPASVPPTAMPQAPEDSAPVVSPSLHAAETAPSQEPADRFPSVPPAAPAAGEASTDHVPPGPTNRSDTIQKPEHAEPAALAEWKSTPKPHSTPEPTHAPESVKDMVPCEVALDFKEVAPLARMKAARRPIPVPSMILLAISLVSSLIACSLFAYAWTLTETPSSAYAQPTATSTRKLPTVTPTIEPGARPTSVPTIDATAPPESHLPILPLPTATAAARSTAEGTGALNLDISATLPITVNVGVDGVLVFSGPMPAGTSRSWSAKNQLYLRIENPVGAAMLLNGSTKWLAPRVFAERSLMERQWTVDASGRLLPATPVPPSPTSESSAPATPVQMPSSTEAPAEPTPTKTPFS